MPKDEVDEGMIQNEGLITVSQGDLYLRRYTR